jgi:hypothetical protein
MSIDLFNVSLSEIFPDISNDNYLHDLIHFPKKQMTILPYALPIKILDATFKFVTVNNYNCILECIV